MKISGFLPAALVAVSLPVMAAAQDVPPAVSALGLQNIEVRDNLMATFGSDIRGTLPGGVDVEIDLDGDGRIDEIEARQDNTYFPVSEINSLIPEAIQQNDAFPADALLESIDFKEDGRIEMEGNLADGRPFEAEFSAAGELIKLDTDR